METMRMRRCHAIQMAREIQRAKNRNKKAPVEKPKKRGLFKRLLGIG